LNYRHAFHAGNFADVFKHALLVLLLKSFHAKDKPFVYLETHAGAGCYDLESEAARKTGVARDGIGRLWARREEFPELSDYFAAVRALNRGAEPCLYPGSPRVAHPLLRPQDRMVLFELMPEECAPLRDAFARDARVHVHCQDGYAGLKAQLPPPERRGLVLIDPPYEAADEFDRILEGLALARARWATGTYAVWYPIKDRPPVKRFHERLTATGIRKMLAAELSIYPEDTAFRLNGCGMVLVNPPWQIDRTLAGLLPRLLGCLRQNHEGNSRVVWLVKE
jgi:23S rRNA (adenine2030-N6)-methyltransferase